MVVHPCDTVASLKARLHPLLGTAEEDDAATKLYHNGAEFGAKLEGGALPLSEFGVDSAFSVVYVNPQCSKLQVKLPSGKVVVVGASHSDTLSHVKAKLAPLVQLPVEDLHMVWNGTPLYDGNHTLREYDVPADAALEVTESFGVTVCMPDGTTVVLQTIPNEPLKSLKARLAIMVAFPVDLQQLHHGTNGTNGNNIAGQPLDDSKSLQSYNIPKGSTLELNPGAFPIVVSLPNGKHVPIYVLPSDTFDDLKAKLEKVEGGGVPKLKAPLFHLGAEVAGGVTLADANVQPNDTVYLDPKQFNVDVRGLDRKTFPLKVTPADHINTLRKKLGKVQGIPPEELRFVCDSTALGSDPRIARDDYGVQPGAVMDLTHGTSVAVRTPDGRVITLDYEPEKTVASLKQRVQTFDGRVPEPDEEVRLLFNGRELADLHPLADYELPKNGVVDLVSGMTLFVRTPQAKLLTLDVNPSDTVQDVKRKIKNMESIPVTYPLSIILSLLSLAY